MLVRWPWTKTFFDTSMPHLLTRAQALDVSGNRSIPWLNIG
jgi:hypothetical protein